MRQPQQPQQHPSCEQPEPGALPSFTREQLLLTGGTLLTSGVVDLAAHFNPAIALAGLLATYAMGRLSPEVIKMLLPGGDPDRTLEATSRFVDRLAPPLGEEEAQRDQALGAKLKRLVGMKGTRREQGVPKEASDHDELYPSGSPGQQLVRLAPDLAIPLADIAGKAILITGMRRSGKTTLGALLAEQFGQFDIPLFIPDFEGDYVSLAEVLPRVIIAGHPDAASLYTRYDFAAITHANAAALGYDLLEAGLQVVLDLSSYPTLEEGIAAQVQVIRGMFAWAKRFPEKRVPCHIYLDEAQRYLPENLRESVIDDKVVLDLLFKAYKDILAIGGKRGLSPVILTQRLAQVNKKIMAQSEVIFVMRQTNDTDLERCMDYVKKTTASPEDIFHFHKGEGVYIADDGTQHIHRFHQRRSNGARSATPTVERAARYKQIPVSRLSLSRENPTALQNRAQNPVKPGEGESGEMPVKDAGRPGESTVKDGERLTQSGEGFTISQEDEVAVVYAAFQLQLAGANVTREAIKQKLGWNNKKHEIVKAVCDKHGIAKR